MPAINLRNVLRRNPDRPSLRERAAVLKASAAKVIGKGQRRHRWPRLAGGGEPSKAMSDLIEAHMLAYARCLQGMGEDGADVPALRIAEEEAFRALLHAPLTSDADRGCYAAAVIERENGFLVRGYAGTRNDPLSVAYRNLRFGEYAREPEEMRHVGHPALAKAAPNVDTAAASMGDDPRLGLIVYADASGKLIRNSFDRALSFMAMRLRGVASTELSRRFNAGYEGLDEAGCRELDARLRRELRLDALDILVSRHGEAFTAAQAKRDGIDPAMMSAEQVDLSSCSIPQIARLYEAFHATYDHLSALGQLSCFWENSADASRVRFNPAGDIVDREADRLAELFGACAEEIARREPRSARDSGEILLTRVMHELTCNGCIDDPALMRDVTTAWGA